MRCDYCGSGKYRVIFDFKDCKVVKCKDCSLVQMTPIIVGRNSDDYSNLSIELMAEYIEGIRWPQFKRDLLLIKKHVPSGKILDIGCSTGLFLNLAKSQNYETHGFEPGTSIYRYSQDKYSDLNIINSEFDKNAFREGFFDVITLWSVLEHATSPDAILNDCRYLIGENGIIAIRVPNYNSLIPFFIRALYILSMGMIASPAKALYEYSFNYKHFYHFNQLTLTNVLNKNGFQVQEIKYENSINMNGFKQRIQSSERMNDLQWMNNRISIFIVKIVLMMAKLLDLEDEMVVFARKT